MLKNVEMKYEDTWSRVLGITTQLRHSVLYWKCLTCGLFLFPR